MFGINEILYKVFNKKTLSEEDKFRISTSKKIDRKVIKYLSMRYNPFIISRDFFMFNLLALNSL